MLNNAKLMAFVGITDEKKATGFYGKLLGLPKISNDSFAVVFDADGVLLRAALVPEVVESKYTVLGWQVGDIKKVVRDLTSKGIKFERYGFMQQDELGIWETPGAKVAWFRDPFGNLLSVSEHAGGS